MSRSILFVDDEPNILAGLERALRPMQAQWEMTFVSSGAEALQTLELHPFDVVVTDMRMPGMTGAQLLDEVRDQFPLTIRMVLSGQSERESMVRSVASAHQILSKPCEAEQLKSTLEKTVALTDLLKEDSIKSFVYRLKSIPSIPALYQKVAKELNSENLSVSQLAGIISQDIAMTAKVLQMANAPVYSSNVDVSDPSQAVILLGRETIQAMLLSFSIFSPLDPHVLGAQEVGSLSEQGNFVSQVSTIIAKAEGIAACDLGPYQSAGLLHKIGKAVAAAADPTGYRMIENLSRSAGQDQCIVENQVMGCTHAEIGACLLGLWGLPSSIVDAVAWHHHPSDSPVNKFSPLAAVHVAGALHAQMYPEFKHWDADLDQAFLERIGLAERQEVWMEQCSAQIIEAQPA